MPRSEILFRFALASLTTLIACSSRAQADPFDVVDLPNTIGIYDSVEYLDVNANGLLLANGYDSETDRYVPFLVESNGENLREIVGSDQVWGSFLHGYLNDSGAGFLYSIQNGSEGFLNGFDANAMGRTLPVRVPDGSLFFAEDLTDAGQLAASIGPEGGPFSHVLIGSTGDIQNIPSGFSPLGLTSVGPDALLGFQTFTRLVPFVSPPSIVFDTRTTGEQSIPDAEIAAISSASRFWLQDSKKGTFWVRTNGVDSKKIRLAPSNVFTTTADAVYANDNAGDLGATYVSATLDERRLTCAFPAAKKRRKYLAVIAVAGNRALVRFSSSEGRSGLTYGAALVSAGQGGKTQSYCAPVRFVRNRECKLEMVTPNAFLLKKGGTSTCQFDLRFSGALAVGMTPVAITVLTDNGTTKKHLVIARDGKLRVGQSIAADALSIRIDAPKDGFKNFHTRAFTIAVK